MLRIKGHFASHWRAYFGGGLLIALALAIPKYYDEVAPFLKQFPLQAFLFALILSVLQVLFMGLRFWGMTPHKSPAFEIVWVMAYGQFANAFFPARAGDALKIATLSDKKKGLGLPYLQSSGIYLADRIFDIGALILCGLLLGAHKIIPRDILGNTLFYGVPLLLLCYPLIKKILLRFIPNLNEKISQFGHGLKSVLDYKKASLTLLFAMLTWATEALAFSIVLSGIGVPLEFSQIMATLILLNLAIAIPISVANVGPFEGAVIYALKIFGITTGPALAVATIHHIIQIAGTVLLTGILKICRLIRKRSI